MIILHIASLNDNRTVGPNINVPKNVIYGNKYEKVGLLNINSSNNILFNLSEQIYFDIKKYKNISSLPKPFNMPDIVVFQSLYFIEFCKIAKELKKKNIPYIIVPRCSMTKSAIQSKKIKKIIGNFLLFNKFVKGAKYIQFLTQHEYLESKNTFKYQNYFIIGNGVEYPKKHYLNKKHDYFKIIFIGRYDVYHKGLDCLLEAIKNHYEWFDSNKVKISFYGSDNNHGDEQYLKKYIDSNKINGIITINGPIFGKEKENVLINSDAFIHTSRLEGQPTSVIEAISYGVPVIVTPGTNIVDEVIKYDLGFTCDFNPNSVFKCIKKAYESKNNLNVISKNEREYTKRFLDWSVIIKDSINIYYKIIDEEKINAKES